MQRLRITPRPHWKLKAREYGFNFHTLQGEPYWQEDAYYSFTLDQIEQDIEAPTVELHQMCLHAVNQVVSSERLMQEFCIPQAHWNLIAESWRRQDPSLYSRLDLAYTGHGPAKLLENNADTPTSLYETGFWQWLWLEEQMQAGLLPAGADQFNLLQEKLIERFRHLKSLYPNTLLHLSCCKDSNEDRGTVQYLADCALEAGIANDFVYIEDIGLGETGRFSDLNNGEIEWLFKLYPWEFMLRRNVCRAYCRQQNSMARTTLESHSLQQSAPAAAVGVISQPPQFITFFFFLNMILKHSSRASMLKTHFRPRGCQHQYIAG